VAAGGGRVVFFSAAGADAEAAKTRAPIYFAAKAALVSLSKSLAAEVASSGVTVNVVSPGIIRHADSHQASQDRMASQVPLGRCGEVADVLGAIDLLLSERGAYITGSNITIDGGLSL
jgi:3-oxoacyl-[acyl-carrier protein] reductase